MDRDQTARAYALDNRVKDLVRTIRDARETGGHDREIAHLVYNYLLEARLAVDFKDPSNRVIERLVEVIHEKGLGAPQTRDAIADAVKAVPVGSNAVHVLVFTILRLLEHELPPRCARYDACERAIYGCRCGMFLREDPTA
jgi:hypothetical protein